MKNRRNQKTAYVFLCDNPGLSGGINPAHPFLGSRAFNQGVFFKLIIHHNIEICFIFFRQFGIYTMAIINKVSEDRSQPDA